MGAHGCNPHQSEDPVAAAAAVVSGVHQIVSRVVEPSETAVISIGYINGGKAFNVIPDEVTLGGTIRLTDPDTQFAPLFETISSRVKDIASGYGCSAEVIDRNGEASLNSRGEEFKVRPPLPIVVRSAADHRRSVPA